MWLKREEAQKEQIDAPSELIPFEEYRAASTALAWSNHRWGGYSTLLRPLKSMVRHRTLQGFTVLDVGCGVGDVDEFLVNWSRKNRLAISIIGIDSHPHAVRLSIERRVDYPEIKILQADFFEAKFSDASFDFVVSSLLLHHLPPEQISFFLLKSFKLARVGVILADLRRSLPAYLFSKTILPRLAPKSPIFAHDAPLSFRRAYTLKETREFLLRGGYPYMATIPWHSPFRMVLVAEHLLDKK